MLQFLIMNAASNYDFIIFFKTYTKNFTIIKFGPCKNENNHALRTGLWKQKQMIINLAHNCVLILNADKHMHFAQSKNVHKKAVK